MTESASASKPRVLVVDDSRLIQKAIRKMLEHEFDVAAAVDGVEAWAIIEVDPAIQVVFSDLDMPRMDGFELLRTIRAATDTRVQELPVIIVTGARDDDAARREALELGATDFITKPFASTDLVARARAHASHQRLTRELRAQTTLDALTGLLNRAGFLQRLQQDISYARRHQQALSLLRLEIDDLRGLFLRHGKEAAERLLTHVAALLRANIRTEDSAARIGLGGFALSLPAVTAEAAQGLLQRLREEVLAGSPLPLRVLGVRLGDLGADAQAALEQAQAELERSRPATSADGAAATSATVASPAPRPVAAPAPAPQNATVAPPRPAAADAAPLRLDPILDAVARGEIAAAQPLMPQILQRLLPLLRLGTAAQRAGLARLLLQAERGHG